MRLQAFLFILVLTCLSATESSANSQTSQWNRITVAPMKTSIYVGSVKLVTGLFEKQGATLTTTYEAKVVPWFFWSETGNITVTLTDADIANLAKGQTTEFKGDATNQKNKPRKVTGRAQPADGSSGKIKVRVMADGIELIFNGTYQLGG